jgi:hypothetical protein
MLLLLWVHCTLLIFNRKKDKHVNENFIQNMNNKQTAENRSNTVNNNTMAIINKM